MDFGEAIKNLKMGRAIGRTGWNGKGMYVIKKEIEGMEPFLTIVQGERVNTWVPSISDLMSEDWVLVMIVTIKDGVE